MNLNIYDLLDRADAWRQRHRDSRFLRLLPRTARIWVMQPAWQLYQCSWCGWRKSRCDCRAGVLFPPSQEEGVG